MKNFVLDTFTVNGNMKTSGRSNKFISKNRVLIIGRTRALMFDKIDKAIHKKYESDPPIVYSLPIVNMDWDHASELEQKLKV